MALNRQEVVEYIDSQIEELQRARAIFAVDGVAATTSSYTPRSTGRRGARSGRTLSAAARKRISQAMKERWAKRRSKAA
jgi:hypothetical protein